MPTYDCVTLARLLDERLDLDSLTRRGIQEVTCRVLSVAEELKADQGLDCEEDVEAFIVKFAPDDEDDADDEDDEFDESDEDDGSDGNDDIDNKSESDSDEFDDE